MGERLQELSIDLLLQFVAYFKFHWYGTFDFYQNNFFQYSFTLFCKVLFPFLIFLQSLISRVFVIAFTRFWQQSIRIYSQKMLHYKIQSMNNLTFKRKMPDNNSKILILDVKWESHHFFIIEVSGGNLKIKRMSSLSF